MAIRINYNEVAALSRRSAGTGRDRFGRAAEHVATGSRINTAVDDTAGMAVAQRLKNQARSLTVAGRNAQQAISLVQVADGAYAETQSLYRRMRELAIQAATDTINATDRANLQAEMSALSAEVTRIGASTQLAGTSLATGSTFQIGPNATTSANQVAASLPSSGSTTNSLNALFAVTAGANSVDVGNQAGIAYDGSTDTATTFTAAINAAGGNITASITSDNKLRLESTTAVSPVFANDTGNVASTLFGANATTNAVTSATTLADLGISAGGTMTITATESSGGGGSPTLASLGISSGDTLTIGLQKAAGTGGAPSTSTLADIGVAAGGTVTMKISNGSSTETRQVVIPYALTETLTGWASKVNLALREAAAMTANGTTPTNGFTVTITHPIVSGPPVAIAMATNTTSYTPGTFTLNAGPINGNSNIFTILTDSNTGTATLLKKLALATNTGPTATTLTSRIVVSGSPVAYQVNTAAFSESVTYTVGSETDITALASGLQAAIRGAGKLGTSQSYDVSAATVSLDGSNHLVIDVSTGSSGVIIGTISGTNLPTVLGLSSAPAASSTTSTATFSATGATQTETATVTYATTDTLAGIATKIAAAVTGIGSVGSSSVANGAGSAAAFNAGTRAIDITGVDTNTSLAFSSGALQTALNFGTPNTSVSGTVSSSGSIVQDKYRLDSITLTGSGSSSTVDISTQAAASAAISSLDTSIDSVSTTRASLGALQTQLDSAARTISVAAENASVAESRISDADLAEFMSEMVQAQIREQAGISMMVQANQAPSIVLQLLK